MSKVAIVVVWLLIALYITSLHCTTIPGVSGEELDIFFTRLDKVCTHTPPLSIRLFVLRFCAPCKPLPHATSNTAQPQPARSQTMSEFQKKRQKKRKKAAAAEQLKE